MDHNTKNRGRKSDNKYSQNTLDAGIYSKLDAIVKDLQNNSKDNTKDYNQLIQFCEKGYLNQLVQNWSYYAQVNNHSMFVKSTILLSKILNLINQNASIVDHGDQIIKLLLTDYLKVIYRGLNNLRVTITNPILFLLKDIINFNNSKHVEDFLSFFDFSLSSLIKILTPTKYELENTNFENYINYNNNNSSKSNKTVRAAFIEFWIDLIDKTPPLLRKDLLVDNAKIMGAWFKYMDKCDSSNLMINTMNTFINDILNEKSFKRMTKTKILNEFALSKLHQMYYSTNKDLVNKTNDFFLAYGYRNESSVSFPDNCVWFDESPNTNIIYSTAISTSATTNMRAPVLINQREFKLYNKMLFNILKLFKPWEDDLQSVTLIKILKANPGLVAPYCAYLSTLGSHDPRMTSYWFGMTLLLDRIINLPIPEFMKNVETDMIPSISLVMENIIPSSLTRNSLTKMLQNDILVVKQLGCQLLIFAFQKLIKILALYDRKGWNSSKSSINTSFFNNIPDLNIIVNALNQVYINHKDNKMILLSLTVILKYYSQCFPNFFSVTLPSKNIYQDIMSKKSFNGVELTILDNFLQFQEFNSTQTKWWNSTDGESSLFVSLLKLASSPNTKSLTSMKVTNLLRNLLDGSVIFREDLLVSLIEALVSSLKVVSKTQINLKSDNDKSNLDSIWKLIDQSILRAIKTPYKYVTMSQPYENISPCLMVLAEQWKYINQEQITEEQSNLTIKWILIFYRIMVIIGEDQDGVTRLMKDYFPGISNRLINSYLNFSDCNVEYFNKPEYLLKDCIDSSFFHYVSLLEYKKLKIMSRVPVCELDITALLFKIKLVSIDQNIKYDSYFKDTIMFMFEQLADYLVANNSNKISNNIKVYSSYFDFILEHVNEENSMLLEKHIFVAQQILLIINNLANKENDILRKYLFKWVSKIITLGSSMDNKEITALITLAVTFLDSELALSLVQSNFTFTINTVVVLLSIIANDTSKHINFNIIKKYLRFQNDLVGPLVHLIENKQVNDINVKELIPVCLLNSNSATILKSLLSSNLLQGKDMIPYINEVDDISVCVSIVELFDLSNNVNDEMLTYIKRIVGNCYNKLKELDDSIFENVINLFIKHSDLLSQIETDNILLYISTEYVHKYNGTVINFIRKVANFDEDFIIKWMNKMTVYITKYFSDRDTLTSKFERILKEYTCLINKVNIWEKVNHNIINSQLEVIFSKKWVKDNIILRYGLTLIFGANKRSIECEKIVNIIVNNEESSLVKGPVESENKFLTVLSLYALFNFESEKCSNIPIQKKLLTFYSGSMSASDKLILKILEMIETKISTSWTNLIYTWDLLENSDIDIDLIGETKLITEEKEGLILTLRKDLVEYSLQNYILTYPSIPTLSSDLYEDISRSIRTFDLYFNEFKTINNFKDEKIVYDPFFLLLLSIQNDELVKCQKDENGAISYKFVIKNFITSKLLNLVIYALSDPCNRINDIALSLLTQMVYSLEDSHQFKGENIYKILLKKIVFTVQKNRQSEQEQQNQQQHGGIPPILWFFVSNLCDILNQPLSSLYEKTFRWILNGSFIRSNDLPMVHELMSPNYSDSINDIYYSQLSWVLHNLEFGIRTQADFEFLKRKGIIEWLYTMLNNPYLNNRLISMIKSIFYKIQRIDTGASVLITRYAALSDLDMSTVFLEQLDNQMNEKLRKNNKNSKNIRKKLLVDEQLLNNKELMMGYSIIISNNKRLRDWTENEVENIKKRICDSSVKLPQVLE